MNSTNPYAVSSDVRVAALADQMERTAFIQRTYLHLGGAVLAFVLLEAILLSVIPADTILGAVRGRWTWLVFLGMFMVVSWVARSWAESNSSSNWQYAGLGLYVVAEAVIFLPLLALANTFSQQGESIALNAGIVTGIVFAGLTAMVFITGADFSWMGRFLCLAGLGALGLIVCGMVFGFTLGLFFTGAMIALAAGYILYDTSNIMHHYRTNQHVAASLALFASVALLFWYVIQMFISMRDE